MSLGEEWERQSAAWIRFTPHDVFFERYNWPAFRELLPPAGRATLDVGCGEGRIGEILRGLGHRMTGVDIAPSMVARAAERGAFEAVVVADAAALPFVDGAFDTVVAFMSLQDMDDPASALREIVRVLEPGGVLVAAVVHPFNTGRERPYFDVARLVDEFERGGVTMTFHQIHRPLESWFALIADAGLEIEALREPRAPAEPVFDHVRDRPVFLHLRCARP